MEARKLVSGIKPTGSLTLGNYLGAIKNFVKLQDEYEMYIFVADLHSLTEDIDPNELRKNKKDIMALYIAAGLDPKKVTLFNQSEVREHGESVFIFENMTTVGELSRMTQYKDKSLKYKESNGTEKIKTGLLTYPALMAGDILLYNADFVLVGADQKQHLELTRNIAERFNNKYGSTIRVPEVIIPKVGARIMSLQDPTKKMSKTDKKSKSYILLLDDPEVAYKKIMKSVTDSEGKVYLSDDKPGVRNLLQIHAAIKDITLEKSAEYFKDVPDYGIFKKQIATLVKELLIDLQSKYKEAINKIDKIALVGSEKAKKITSKNLRILKEKVGLL